MNLKSRPGKKPLWLRAAKESGLVFGLGIFVVAIATWFTFQFIEPAPPRTLTIASGSIDGAYRGFAIELREQLLEEDVELNVIETAGSVDNLERLATGSVDIAFMQSGLAGPEEYPQLESLGALYYEPVWIFTRQGFTFERLAELASARISAGGVGSGSRIVAQRLLESNGLSESQMILDGGSGMDAVRALEAGQIDVLFSVASVSAPMIDALLKSDKAQLATLARAPAYARREPWLTHLTLPEGVVDLTRNVPPSTADLLAVNATLVATVDLHPALRDLLLQAVSAVFSKSSVLASAEEFPRAIGSEFALASVAQRYYEFGPPFLQRYLPFWIANLVDRLKLLALPLLALLIPLSRMLPPAYRWTVRKKIYRWYDQVQDCDQLSNSDTSLANLQDCAAELTRIENEVRDIEVPLGYAHELYVLRQHIELLSAQVRQKLMAAGGVAG